MRRPPLAVLLTVSLTALLRMADLGRQKRRSTPDAYWGYKEALEAIADPTHERHSEISEWWGIEDLDPNYVDVESIEAGLLRLARRWAPKPRKK